MKKKQLQPQPNYEQWKKDFLMDMLAVYYKEKDESKRERIRKSVNEHILSNREMVKNILNKNENSQERDNIVKFLNDETMEYAKELKKYKLSFDDLAFVSVKCDFWDRLSPLTSQELKRNTNCLQDIDTTFEKGDIWEYAVLSKDKKSFILLRDFVDKKVQPIENCEIWRNSSISQLHLEDDKNGLKIIGEVPPSVYWVDDACKFTKREIRMGVFAENLYAKNIDCIAKQMEREMHRRTVWYKEKLKLKKENEVYNARPTFEF